MQTEQVADDIAEATVAEKYLTAGDTLREERLRQNLSEKEVADRLHITMHYVKALESNNYEKLPGAVFAKGYIKSYALLLKLDEDNIIGQYDDFRDRQLEREKEKTLIQVRRRRDKNRPWVVLSVLGFIGVFLALWAFNNFLGEDGQPVAVTENSIIESVEDSAQESVEAVPVLTQSVVSPSLNRETPVSDSIPSVEESAEEVIASDSIAENNDEDPVSSDFVTTITALSNQPVAADSIQAQQVPDQANTTALNDAVIEIENRVIEISSAGSDVLRISFSGESWVEVNDETENQIYRDIRGAGDILEITGNAPFSILLGDAPFTRLTFNGTEVDVSNNIRIDNSAHLTVGL
jgi:cytoskeleton protein RodZ